MCTTTYADLGLASRIIWKSPKNITPSCPQERERFTRVNIFHDIRPRRTRAQKSTHIL